MFDRLVGSFQLGSKRELMQSLWDNYKLWLLSAVVIIVLLFIPAELDIPWSEARPKDAYRTLYSELNITLIGKKADSIVIEVESDPANYQVEAAIEIGNLDGVEIGAQGVSDINLDAPNRDRPSDEGPYLFAFPKRGNLLQKFITTVTKHSFNSPSYGSVISTDLEEVREEVEKERNIDEYGFLPSSLVVSWDEAKHHIGQTETVEGTVVEIVEREYGGGYANGGGIVTYINLGNTYPDKNRFTIVVWQDDQSDGFVDSEATMDAIMMDNKVQIHGKIRDYNGVPEITLSRNSQLRVASNLYSFH